MAAPPRSLDYWRGFFNGAQASIFDAIDAAIRVAAADHPDGLRARRAAIAEHLYTVLPPSEEAVWPAPAFAGAPPLQEQHGSSDGPAVSTHRDSSGDPVVAEAVRVKAALSSNQQKSEDELLDLLRRLQLLQFTVDTVRVTEIIKAVQPLRKHASKQIRQLAGSLIEGWQATVNEWMNNEAAIIDHTPQSMDVSCLEQEEGGLPSPPMDEAALFATSFAYRELSEFFDEMDDDGNTIINGKEDEQQYPTNEDSVKEQPSMVQQYDPVQNWRLDQSAVRQSRLHELSGWQVSHQSMTEAQGKPSNAAFGLIRPSRLHSEPIGSKIKISPKQLQDISVAHSQRRPKPTMPNQRSNEEYKCWIRKTCRSK
ncbi:probable mediator of RNA polymerase II transcription subunit 26a isoform X2 [Brachypodium distachyon]|uniref:TFIIS N-terminal domain-containing protein n=1 Tax=Brachypodium distachyon TaxID=15368 RepID=A0A2K2DSV1_BRADI|nr:probable mediator of RNA polymerase II transcription subunit 26a isoform X2 [Brachypodium distachyon]PNT77361.1 hypothetical protein BRADI_1g61653v3 [Brachypodium distachyon]|eukprot:XP_014752077.1 probable mediator of RNA polymerase II transcription subunit 26a isoform X2 [Brachypodium distachyon]